MKTILVVAFAALCAALGEALIAVGMKQMGDASALGLAQWRQALLMFLNPKVLLGVGFTIVFFALFSWSLSWADLSYVQPLTALSFVFGVLIARYALGEAVSWWRWVGVIVIIAGVTLVSLDPRQLTR
jgi:drug/metabolite transporter (DMT)-like permease